MEEYKRSSSIQSLSLSSQEESAEQPITSKTSKATLIFIKSLNDQFVYHFVTYVPNQLQIKSKEKSKQSSRYIQSVKKNDEMLTSKSNKNNQSQRSNEEKVLNFTMFPKAYQNDVVLNKGKKKAEISGLT
ncbi:uncharacterized protein F5891DRAFT_1193908 [Suillus fuscotomentosus]|uniref:Uncharacterized protein n=1 Tax=Suillus fuscotomentosus TaxID=1912939 RepID=A0AAD4DY04_9AGAM|nr:uncharacterized protein F5891DRAFT_1193908 [Suillus fuscotomentosus]KAG1895727.1 hypothetical protein F5891DRAFT_1193908 [Suillus fuscotomentosus]